MPKNKAYIRSVDSVSAIMAIMDWLKSCRRALAKSDQVSADQLDAEIRDAMENASEELLIVLEALALPIWPVLPVELKLLCRIAGVEEGPPEY